MTLKDWREEIDYFTGELTKLIRNICFAGLVASWVLKTTMADKEVFPLTLGFICFFLSLFFDIIFLWYSASVANKTFHEKETELSHMKFVGDLNIENCDLGGWNPSFAQRKNLLRRVKVISCISGCIALAYFGIQS